MADDTELDPLTPVLVGVGTAYRPVAGGAGPDIEVPDVEALELMVEAAAAAFDDAAFDDAAVADQLRSRLGWVAVPVGTWSYSDAARLVADRLVADRLRAETVHTVRVEVGVSQQTPVRVAWELIAAGELDVALVVGGEAKATEQRRSRAGLGPIVTEQNRTEQDGVDPDECWSAEGEIVAQAEIDAGMWDAVEHYACIDNALAAADAMSLDEQLDTNAELWHRLNQAAAANPEAAFPEHRDARFLRVPGPGNRPLAHPYAKWHSTQWGVDQAGALLLCSVAVARELGVQRDRWVFPRVLVESSSSVPLSCRAELHRWPAMEVLGRAAADHLAVSLESIEHRDIYSCFPSAVRVQQRELGLDPADPSTSTGGMSFGGGPFNNYTYQSTAAVVRAVRADPGSLGLVTTVSGLLTKPALAVWSSEPGAPALVADLADRADEVTARRRVVAEHTGSARVATFTVTHEGGVAAKAFVIADVDDSTRWIGTSDEPGLLAAGLSGELIGRTVTVDGATCTLG